MFGLAFYTLRLHPSFVSMVIFTTSPTTAPSPDVKQGAGHKPPSHTTTPSSEVKQGAGHKPPSFTIPSSEVKQEPYHVHKPSSQPNTSPLDVKQQASQTHKPSLPNTQQGSHRHRLPSHTTPSLSDVKQKLHKPANTDDSFLATLLASLKFNNYGLVESSDQFVMQDIPCRYG